MCKTTPPRVSVGVSIGVSIGAGLAGVGRGWQGHTDMICITKAFLGICVYYRNWIKNYSLTTEPIYRLLKENKPWV
jgi:hypothetical protein